MANVKERYTQVTRESRSGRFVPVRTGRSSQHGRDNDAAEEERLASTFRRRAREDYRTAS